MRFYTLEQRRPLRPVTPRAVMQTHDIAGATNWAKAPGEHAKGLNTKRSVDPQEPVYALPAARPNRWYEGAPAPTIDPIAKPIATCSTARRRRNAKLSITSKSARRA